MFVRSVILLVSHSAKLAISLPFASHSEKKLAISVRAPFLERSVFQLRAFLCAQHFLFASHSAKLASSIRRGELVEFQSIKVSHGLLCL